MRLRLTLTLQGLPSDTTSSDCHEVEVEGPPGGRADELAAALAAHTGLPPGTRWELSCGGIPLGPQAPVGRAPLVDGAAVSLAEPGHCAVPPRAAPRSAVTLAVTHGPDAGRAIEIARGRHTIGRSPEADLCLDDQRLSRLHAEIEVGSDTVSIRDLSSTNGTRLDDHLVGPTSTSFNAGAVISLGGTTLGLRPHESSPAASTAGPEGTCAVNRRPRVPREAPQVTITLPAPPDQQRRLRVNWVAVGLPIPVAAVMALVAGPAMIVFALMSPLLMVGTALGDRVGRRRVRASQLADHERATDQAMALAASACDREARLRRCALPDPAEVLAIAATPTARLWERRRSDPDLLLVSVGQCSAPTDSVRLVREGGGAPPAPLWVTRVPAPVPLGSVGVLGICGPRERVVGAARSVLGQLAALHSPRDLELIAAAAGERHARDWHWLARLPHLRGPDGGARAHALVIHSRDTGPTIAAVGQLAAVVRARTAQQPPGGGWDGPRTVLVIDGAAELRAVPGITQIMELGPRVGVCTIALAETRAELPSEAAGLLDLTDVERSALSLLGVEGHLMPPDLAVDRVGNWWADRLSRALAPLRDAAPDVENAAPLPTRVSLAEVSQVVVTDAAAVQRLWESRPCTTIVPVGRAAEGAALTLDLAADGPHLLVAGTTGSGKSELLRTLVTSLAVHNRPEHLSLLLVDYKGGAAFRECAGLPHISGIVTDLDAHLAARALTSLKAELRRRERILSEALVSDFDGYVRLPVALEAPLPRLVVVVDEFRALAQEVPAFVDGMVRIAALGRSLGVHVVLATQRPAGVVTADIKANMNLRIALRVRDRADSDDVIDSSDAVDLDPRTPGRACVRRGDGRLSVFQAACVSGPSTVAEVTGFRVRAAVWGRPPHAWPAPAHATGNGTTELAGIVQAVRRAAGRLDASPAPPAWLPPLRARIEFASLTRHSSDQVIALGMTDDPAAQSQKPLLFDLTTPSHWGFVGAAGSGRSTALMTVALGLATRCDPSRLHIYAISGGGLAALERLPHCGAHVRWDDLPRLERLVTRLEAVVASRREASVAERVDGASAILVVVDDWDSVAHGGAEAVALASVGDRLLALLRDGARVGVRGAIAGERALLTGRAAGVVTERVVLRLADPVDAALAGLPAASRIDDSPPGRGWLPGGVEVQLALPPTSTPRLCADIPAGQLPLRVQSLPALVRAGDLPRPSSGTTILGVGGDDLEAVGLAPARDGRRWLVTGAPASGVTTTLLRTARDLSRDGRALAVVTGRPGPLDAMKGDPRVVAWCDPDDPGLLAATRRTHHQLVVVVDDADELVDSPIESVIREIARRVDRDGGLIVCGARSAALLTQYRGVAVEIARHRTGVLLGPPSSADGDIFGFRLRADRGAPPGRGYLIQAGGALPLQVALPDL